MAGWVKIHRQIQDNAIWMSDEPFDSRSAWIDLILMANHEDKEVYQGGQFFKIKRGQLHRSQIKLAERWHWSKKRVIKYLKELKKVRMIDFETFKGGATQGTTITIVNYDTFQVLGATEGTSVDTSEGASPEQRSTHKQEYKNDKEIKKEREEPELPQIKPSRFPTGKYNNVFLSQEECASLSREYGQAESQRVIEKLSEYMATHKTKYKDDGHYAIICQWIREDKEKPKTTKSKAQDFNQRNYTDDEYLAFERKKLGIT